MLGLSDIIRDIASLPLQALNKTTSDSISNPYTEDELAALIKNIRATVWYLACVMKKRVVVVDWPTSGAMVGKFGEGKVKRLNRQLRQVCDEVMEESGKVSVLDGNNSAPLSIPCVSLGTNYQILRTENRSFDSLHFNRKGYKILAKEIFENSLRAMMVKVEWGTWKEKLKTDPKSAEVLENLSSAAKAGGSTEEISEGAKKRVWTAKANKREQ